MPSAATKSVVSSGSKKKRTVQQTELNASEEKRLEDLILRYQDIVVARNKKLGERSRAGIREAVIMRAGLLRLEETADSDFYSIVEKAQKRR